MEIWKNVHKSDHYDLWRHENYYLFEKSIHILLYKCEKLINDSVNDFVFVYHQISY